MTFSFITRLSELGRGEAGRQVQHRAMQSAISLALCGIFRSQLLNRVLFMVLLYIQQITKVSSFALMTRP